jgi:hypothetical protein
MSLGQKRILRRLFDHLVDAGLMRCIMTIRSVTGSALFLLAAEHRPQRSSIAISDDTNHNGVRGTSHTVGPDNNRSSGAAEHGHIRDNRKQVLLLERYLYPEWPPRSLMARRWSLPTLSSQSYQLTERHSVREQS